MGFYGISWDFMRADHGLSSWDLYGFISWKIKNSGIQWWIQWDCDFHGFCMDDIHGFLSWAIYIDHQLSHREIGESLAIKNEKIIENTSECSNKWLDYQRGMKVSQIHRESTRIDSRWHESAQSVNSVWSRDAFSQTGCSPICRNMIRHYLEPSTQKSEVCVYVCIYIYIYVSMTENDVCRPKNCQVMEKDGTFPLESG